jgi:iron complex outermembrane receptor protein
MKLNARYGKATLMRQAAPWALAAGVGLFATPALAADAAAPGTVSELGEVIVTATRRAENLQDVPLAITALSGQQVERARVQNFVDIPNIVPGATFVSTKGQSTANVLIRGQAQTNDSPHLSLPVAIFMDDIYFGSTASFSADFFDIEQLAVLRGPQGTTFGRNVVGGALQITSNKPKLGETSGEISAALSKYSHAKNPGFEARGYFNTALSETVAARLGYSFKHIGGYAHNLITGTYLNDQKSFALRPSVRWQPNDKLDVVLTGYYFHEDQNPTGYQSVGQGALVAAHEAIASNAWEVSHNDDGGYKRDIYVVQLRADYDTGFGDLTSITSYRNLDSYYKDDGDSSALPMSIGSLNESKEFQFSQEIRFTSPSDRRFTYVAGAYYSFENIYKKIAFGFNGTVPGSRLGAMHCLVRPTFAGCPAPGTPYGPTNFGPLLSQDVRGSNHVKSYAVFAEGKYAFTDQLNLTVGARYTIEDKSGYTAHDGFSLFYGNPYDVKFSKDWNAFTPRAILDFKPTDELMFYGSVSRGFKGGGWSLTSTNALAAVTPLEPEKSTSYELGAKTRFFDRRLTLNVAAYRADTKNLQVRSLVNGVLNDTNAGVLRVKGVEVEATAIPIDGLTIGINYAYTDAFFKEFRGCAAGGVSCSGNKAPFVPEHDVTVSAEYAWTLANEAQIRAKVDAKWASNFPVGPLGNQPFVEGKTGRNGVLNASLVWESASDLWTAQLWARNITNRYSFTAASNYFFYFLSQAEFARGLNEVDRGALNPPRQVGVTLTRKFQ